MTQQPNYLDVESEQAFLRSQQLADQAFSALMGDVQHVIVANILQKDPVAAFLLGVNLAFAIGEESLQSYIAGNNTAPMEFRRRVHGTAHSLSSHIHQQRGSIQ